MGFGKKLVSLNTASSSQAQQSKVPVSAGGFNTQNIPTLPPPPPITHGELQELNTLSYDTQKSYYGKEVNRFSLVKPSVPTGSEYPNLEVSKLVVEKMWQNVCQKELHAFFTQEKLQDLVNKACKHDYRALMKIWEFPTIDITTDMAALGLYDIVLFIDDSGSMCYVEPEDGMTRFDMTKELIKTVGFWATLMDPDGVVVRFFNSNVEGNGVGSVKEIDDLMKSVSPDNMTPMGEELENKILNRMVLPYLITGDLERPILVITLTDGEPTNRQAVIDAIVKCKNASVRSKYGQYAMNFAFCQIGEDSSATKFLNKIDVDPVIGHLIDCSASFQVEQKECGELFTPSVYIVKMMIGGINPAFDQLDE